MTDKLSDDQEKGSGMTVLIEEENFKKRQVPPPVTIIRAEYQSGTCFFMNPTDFEVRKPTDTATTNSSATGSCRIKNK